MKIDGNNGWNACILWGNTPSSDDRNSSGSSSSDSASTARGSSGPTYSGNGVANIVNDPGSAMGGDR